MLLRSSRGSLPLLPILSLFRNPTQTARLVSRSSRNEPSLPPLVALRHPSYSPIHRLDWQVPSLSFEQDFVKGEEGESSKGSKEQGWSDRERGEEEEDEVRSGAKRLNDV